MHVYWNIRRMHGPINVKSPNNISKLQMGFNSAFKGLIGDWVSSWTEKPVSPARISIPDHPARRLAPIPTTPSRLLSFPWSLQYSLCLYRHFFHVHPVLSGYFPICVISVIFVQVNAFLYATLFTIFNHILHINSSLHFFLSEYFDNICLIFPSSRVRNIEQFVRFRKFRTLPLN
jgi:hypothetical protein